LNELIIVGIARDALKTALYVAAPALIVSMIVGLAVSVFQVVTSLQDPTVAFVPKVLAVMVIVVLSFPWMMRVLGAFTIRMFTDFNLIVKQLP
jgi:flagellar biosynthetic protein FliQ